MVDQPALDQTFFALSSSARRKIVRHLVRRPASATEILQAFEFTKQALSKHVRILEQSGLVRRRVSGRVHELSLVPGRLDQASGWLARQCRSWEANLDRLEQHLASEDG